MKAWIFKSTHGEPQDWPFVLVWEEGENGDMFYRVKDKLNKRIWGGKKSAFGFLQLGIRTSWKEVTEEELTLFIISNGAIE